MKPGYKHNKKYFGLHSKILVFSGLIALALLTWNCEKDDICDDAVTTPRIVIQFYNNDDPSQVKNISNLRILGQDMETALDTLTAVSKIMLPLETTEDFTQYRLTLNAGSTVANEDVLRFNYTRENVYVSRACGYKTIFTLDQIHPFVLTDGTNADGFWIKGITVEEANIENEDEIHINILF